jgi:excinuclease ABC subunit C
MARVDNFKLKNLPDKPGVYFFLGPNNEILYIGKATSLRSRVRSYFSDKIGVSRGPRIVTMLGRAVKVKHQITDSVLEAFILETNLIRHHQPKYNAASKDDRSFAYIVITKEEWPRVLIVRGRDLPSYGGEVEMFGPFPNAGELREALKLIRKIFPFRDRCVPGSSRPCLNAEMGLCPGVCVGRISAAEYRARLKALRLFLQGKKKAVVNNLQKQMKELAKKQEFEEATKVRQQLFALKHIHDVALIKHDLGVPELGGNYRIEAYDVAHLSGQNPVGVMVVVENNQLAKDQYRKFRLGKGTRGNPASPAGGDDNANLATVLTRRLRHDEWALPNLIVVDGGVAQLNTAKKVLAELKLTIPVVGVVKDERHKPRHFIGHLTAVRMWRRAILLANHEAHRFALAYHRNRRERVI